LSVEYVQSNILTCPHGFSTRLGGVSQGKFSSLNLGRLERGDDPAKVAENWAIFGRAVGIDTSRFVHGRQVHQNTVKIAQWADAHSIVETGSLEADGYVTNIPGLPLAVFTADCTPLLLQEPAAGIVGAIHCGWRSTVSDIVGSALAQIQALGGSVQNVRAAIGPCIRACCFQTGPEVVSAVEVLLGGDAKGLYRPDDKAPGKFRVDLPKTVARRLMQLGVPEENIDDLGICTMCHPESYWSHRAMDAARGSQANLIML
jgi:hypothetical protein